MSGQRAGGQRRGPMGGGPMGGGPGGMMRGEKAADFKGTIKKLLGYLRRFWIPMIAVLIFAVASTVLSLWTPKMMGNITNDLVDSFIRMSVYDGVHKAVEEKMGAGFAFPEGTTFGALLDTNSGQISDEMLGKLTDAQIDSYRDIDLNVRPGIDFDAVGQALLFLICLYLVSALFSYVQGFIMSGVSQKVTYSFRRDISEKINRMPLKYFDGMTHGEVLSRVTNDVDTVSQTLNQSLTQMVTSVVSIVGVLIMMLTISWQLTLVALCIVPVSLVLIGTVVGRSQKYFVGQQRTLGELNGHIEETYSGHSIVKVFGAEKRSVETFGEINGQLYKNAWKSQFLSGLMMPMMSFVGNLGYVAICFIGGTLAVGGKLMIGDIQAFLQYLRQFTQPITQMANVMNTLQSTAAAAERVFEFLGQPEETPEAEHPAVLEHVGGAVAFDHVVFGYDSDKVIINGFDAGIRPGQKVAIVGPTGAGKTTMVNLLMRFYDVDSGTISVDGVDIRAMRRADLRRMFGMVLQDTWLFQGTIRENILYGKPGATEEELWRATRAAQVDHFIHSMPGGMDMELNEEVSNISQGQKQLLTIARAMLANPPMLILDEATSSVDTRTEVLIKRAMDNLMEGRTSFIIAHRLSTIRDADLILVMQNGNIVEQGTQNELIAKNGVYAEMYNSQFES